jgi:opacity protein-like surface antigen
VNKKMGPGLEGPGQVVVAVIGDGRKGVMKGKACKVLMLSLAAVFLTVSLASAELIQQFAIGTRVKSWELLGDKNYARTIFGDNVDEKDELYPTNFNMLLMFCPYGGLSVEWDRFGATMGQAGRLVWDTFTLGANFRYALPYDKMKIVPYGVAGITYNKPRFDENNWWRNGWNNSGDYDQAQRDRPSTGDPDQYLKSGRTRDFSVDDNLGWAYGVGVDFFLTQNLALNLDLRWNRASVDGHYSMISDDGRTTYSKSDYDYSLDTVSYGVGFRWFF